MAPYCPPSFNVNSCDSSMQVASNWDPCMLRNICDGCPSLTPMRSSYPLIRPTPSTTRNICVPPAVDNCKLPPITCVPNRICSDHPREDCCRVPSCSPCPPVCTPTWCVERTPPIKKVDTYEPPCQPFDGCSLYRTQFSGCYGPPACSYKPPNAFDFPSARMSDTSIYREHFTCKPICPIDRHKAKSEYQPSCSPFEGCTTYRVDFRGCYGRPADNLKPPSTYDPSSGRMDGTTTYRNEFIPYCPAEYQYARGISLKPEETASFSCSPFAECSTYRMDFPPKCSRKTLSMKPTERYGFSNAPFCTQSTYRNDYLPFCFKDICPPQYSPGC